MCTQVILTRTQKEYKTIADNTVIVCDE